MIRGVTSAARLQEMLNCHHSNSSFEESVVQLKPVQPRELMENEQSIGYCYTLFQGLKKTYNRFEKSEFYDRPIGETYKQNITSEMARYRASQILQVKLGID